MISAYKKGMELFEVGDYFAAGKKFLEAEILLPQSQWASKSVLMASYSYYMQSYYSLAIEYTDFWRANQIRDQIVAIICL